jgi:hypothetical protein
MVQTILKEKEYEIYFRKLILIEKEHHAISFALVVFDHAGRKRGAFLLLLPFKLFGCICTVYEYSLVEKTIH